jgi:hypothetical protein
MDHDDEPTPPPTTLRNQTHLHQTWRFILAGEVFEEPALCLLLVAADGSPVPVPVRIDELPDDLDDDACDHLTGLVTEMLERLGRGASVAWLLGRPGDGRITARDRVQARALLQAGWRAGLRPWPVHVADHTGIRVCAPDDLAASA